MRNVAQVLSSAAAALRDDDTVVYCRRCGSSVFMTDADLAAAPQRRESGDRIIDPQECKVKLSTKADSEVVHKVKLSNGRWELQHRHYCDKCHLFVLYESLSAKDEPILFLHVKNLMLPALAGVSKYPCSYCKRPCSDSLHLKRHTTRCKAALTK
eukprot:Gregarina_sp_Poly_1__1294@NODE_1318_length_4396_cov_107_182721_g890_i0_p3_GENE_NODE_1318_length_4396_cov_107_182721_g890_i0NODE_1318_length_4396_cov_107_182721_g890_i0_p3_ORF_typecomplete_len155_score14_32RecR/PF02132_15/1_6RecR/PF02132_15/1_1RecR/PF02132_15/1_2e03DZR/PF12773_7/0_026DZR/PF12773_7/2_1e02DUF1033/PF06279_11/16DUF1033/PF06279_11/1_8DUF1033/PF06279_11/1_1e04DUF2719/PF10891_8/0_43DUF2719/PF10891_8/3_4e02GFA/PF04828_14/2_2GFA/PF04828_14/2_7GFA/PF04828_14/1_4e03Ribosomal_S27/PF01599_19/